MRFSTPPIAATLSFDPFIGSGSTLIAADKTGRACRGVQLEPPYVDVILRRYEAATGNPAVLIETGVAFGPLALRRAREGSAGQGRTRSTASAVINPWKRRRRQARTPRRSEVRIPARPNLISYATG
jgi:hypothetical protein